MTEGTPGRSPWPARAAGAAKDWLTDSPAHVGYAAVGLVLLLSWPFGGWEPAQEESKAAEVGAEVSAAPFTVSVERAVAGPDLGPPFWPLANGVNPDQDDDQHLVLFLTLRNDSDATLLVSDLGLGLIEVRGVEEPVTSTGAPQPDVTAWGEVYVGHEQPQSLSALGPGLEYEIVLHQAVSGEAPEELEVDLYSRIYRQSSLDDSMLWTDGVLTTTVTVPVETSPTPIFTRPGDEGGRR